MGTAACRRWGRAAPGRGETTPSAYHRGGAAMADGTDNTTTTAADVVPAERIAGVIVVVRGQRVIVDADLAALYGVPTGRVNEAVKRNRDRFPGDFIFRLTADEWARLN